ncbi:MAG: chromosomal replication initiator DnaA [Caulobacteraceae bacterium]|nr:chromosomal replication initiator DnaA [Caulobacteraceae bacterium]
MGRQLRLEFGRPTSFRREDFIVSPSNAPAIQALDAWPHWHAGCLALVGPAGSGKSHLARAWAERTGATVLVGGGEEVLTSMDALTGHPVVIEDADRGAPDEALFHLINRAAAEGPGLLLTARALPSTWSAELPDLRSRLNAMQVAELLEPDDLILEGVLQKFFRERNIRPGEDLIPYLLRRIERSVPYARDLVDRMDEQADAEGKAISRALARQILEKDGETHGRFE